MSDELAIRGEVLPAPFPPTDQLSPPNRVDKFLLPMCLTAPELELIFGVVMQFEPEIWFRLVEATFYINRPDLVSCWEGLPAGAMIRLNPDNPCEVQTSLDGGAVWLTLFNRCDSHVYRLQERENPSALWLTVYEQPADLNIGAFKWGHEYQLQRRLASETGESATWEILSTFQIPQPPLTDIFEEAGALKVERLGSLVETVRADGVKSIDWDGDRWIIITQHSGAESEITLPGLRSVTYSTNQPGAPGYAAYNNATEILNIVFPNPQGVAGLPGTNGADGQDGVSVQSVTFEPLTDGRNGQRMIITLSNGQQTITDLLNGQDGAPGAPGAAGRNATFPSVSANLIEGSPAGVEVTQSVSSLRFDFTLPAASGVQSLYQLPQANDFDRICFAATQMAADWGDNLQDMWELLEVGINVVRSGIEILVGWIGPIGEAAEEVGEATEETWEWMKLNFRDPDALRLAANSLYCLFKNDPTLGDVAISDFFNGLPSSVEAAGKLAFESGLNSALMGYAILAGMAGFYKVKPGLFRAHFARIAQHAEFFDSRDCAGFDDDCQNATVQFIGTGLEAAEGTTLNIPVRLTTTTPLGLPARVAVSVDPTSTIQAADYQLVTNVIEFPAGASNNATQSIEIQILEDTDANVGETIVLRLTVLSGLIELGDRETFNVTISGDWEFQLYIDEPLFYNPVNLGNNRWRIDGKTAPASWNQPNVIANFKARWVRPGEEQVACLRVLSIEGSLSPAFKSFVTCTGGSVIGRYPEPTEQITSVYFENYNTSAYELTFTIEPGSPP